MDSSLKITTYNCRSIKSSVDSVRNLCNNHDVVLLQEHWLVKDELHILSKLHEDFYAIGVSAMDTDNKLIQGRPFGGVGILWRKSLGSIVKTKTFDDTRLLGVTIDTSTIKLLIICVYLPVCCPDNFDEFTNYIGLSW